MPDGISLLHTLLRKNREIFQKNRAIARIAELFGSIALLPKLNSGLDYVNLLLQTRLAHE